MIRVLDEFPPNAFGAGDFLARGAAAAPGERVVVIDQPVADPTEVWMDGEKVVALREASVRELAAAVGMVDDVRYARAVADRDAAVAEARRLRAQVVELEAFRAAVASAATVAAAGATDPDPEPEPAPKRVRKPKSTEDDQ